MEHSRGEANGEKAEEYSRGEINGTRAAEHSSGVANDQRVVELRGGMGCRGGQLQETEEPTRADRFPRLLAAKRWRTVSTRSRGLTLFMAHFASLGGLYARRLFDVVS